MSSDNSFLIAASCAGVNFLLTSFLMLSVRTLWRNRNQSTSWRLIPTAAAISYLATIIANTFRICIALELQRHPFDSGWLSANQVHRLEGIVVYFGFLLFLFVLTERIESRESTRVMRLLFFPLSVYYATTLLLPLLNGGYRQGAVFWEHSAFVLLTPLLGILPIATFVFLKRLKTFSSVKEPI